MSGLSFGSVFFSPSEYTKFSHIIYSLEIGGVKELYFSDETLGLTTAAVLPDATCLEFTPNKQFSSMNQLVDMYMESKTMKD